jgi:YVTN family beta-propeller protein
LHIIHVGNYPIGICVTADNNKIYLANFNGNSVNVIDASTNTVIDTIIVGVNPVAYGNFISTFGTGIPSITPSTASISIYPNPTNSILNIKAQWTIDNAQLTITDVMGNEVYKGILSNVNCQLSIVNYPAGIYFYEIRSNNSSERGKFVVER